MNSISLGSWRSRAALVALLGAVAVLAAPLAGTAEQATYDGDTFRVLVPALPAALQRVGVRVRGIDTPELRGCSAARPLALAARRFTVAGLAAAETIARTATPAIR